MTAITSPCPTQASLWQYWGGSLESTRSHISRTHSIMNSHVLLSIPAKCIPNLHTSHHLPHDDPSQSHHLPSISADSLLSDLSRYTLGLLHSVLCRAVVWQQRISKMQITYNCPAQNLPTASLQMKIKHKLLSRPSKAQLWSGFCLLL